jgi:predicted nucleic acid-binding protein
MLQRVALTAEILKAAAPLRAQQAALRTPDAIHLASAVVIGAAAFVTNDLRLRSAAPLPLLLLSDAQP